MDDYYDSFMTRQDDEARLPQKIQNRFATLRGKIQALTAETLRLNSDLDVLRGVDSATDTYAIVQDGKLCLPDGTSVTFRLGTIEFQVQVYDDYLRIDADRSLMVLPRTSYEVHLKEER